MSEEFKRKKISLDEKIGIFEKFFEQGEELKGQTIFEGYPIGQWGIQIRQQISRGKELSSEQYEKFSKFGILKKQIDSTIDEKIEALVEWNTKYPKARMVGNFAGALREYASSEEEYEQLIEEYEKMQQYYEYVRARNSKQKLTPEQFTKCNEGNVGGVFGVPSSWIQKYGIDKSEIEVIIENHGTVDNFINEYIEGYIIGDGKGLRRAIDIDMQPINDGYDKLAKDMRDMKNNYNRSEDSFSIWNDGYKGILYYSRKDIEELLKNLPQKEEIIVEEIYGLRTGITKSNRKVSDIIGYSGTTIGIILKKALERLTSDLNWTKLEYGEPFLNCTNINAGSNMSEVVEDFKQTIKDNLAIVFNATKDEKQIVKTKAYSIRKIKLIQEKIPDIILEQEKIYNEFEEKELLWSKIIGIINKDSSLLMEEKSRINLSELDPSLPKESLRNFLFTRLGEVFEFERPKIIMNILEDSMYAEHLSGKALLVEGDLDIKEMDLSTRTFNRLWRAGINNLSELLNLNERDFINIRNLGKFGREEILNKIQQYVVDGTAYEENLVSDKNDKKDIMVKIEEKLEACRKEKENIRSYIERLDNLPNEIVQAYFAGNYEKIEDIYNQYAKKKEQENQYNEEIIEQINNQIDEGNEEEQENEEIFENVQIENNQETKTISKQSEINRFLENSRKLAELDSKLEEAIKEKNEVEVQIIRIKEERDKTAKEIQDYLNK